MTQDNALSGDVAARKEREVRTHAQMVKTNDDDDEDMLNGPI